MTLKAKIDAIVSENGLKSQKVLAELLGLNYTLFNRNVNEGMLTGDMIKAFAYSDTVKCNMRWLIREDDAMIVEEPAETFGLSADEKFEKAMRLLHQYKDEVSRK